MSDFYNVILTGRGVPKLNIISVYDHGAFLDELSIQMDGFSKAATLSTGGGTFEGPNRIRRQRKEVFISFFLPHFLSWKSHLTFSCSGIYTLASKFSCLWT
jgi:hypothetical protein